METIHDIIAVVSATPFRKEIIEVDNVSTDGTRDILAAMQNGKVRFFCIKGIRAGLCSIAMILSCHKVFKKDAQAGVVVKEKRFGVEPKITAKIAKKLPIYEVPISCYDWTYEEGMNIKRKDEVWTIWCIQGYDLFK